LDKNLVYATPKWRKFLVRYQEPLVSPDCFAQSPVSPPPNKKRARSPFNLQPV